MEHSLKDFLLPFLKKYIFVRISCRRYSYKEGIYHLRIDNKIGSRYGFHSLNLIFHAFIAVFKTNRRIILQICCKLSNAHKLQFFANISARINLTDEG